MRRGVCASGDRVSAEAGAAVLAEGGSAADAVVAACLLSAVTLPTMTGLGGAGVFLVHEAGRTSVLDAFADVPGRGAPERELPAPDVIPVQFEEIQVEFKVGPASVAVPGQVAGLWALHERLGRLPMERLAAPAIAAARRGTVIDEGQHRAFSLLAELFRRDPATWALIGDEDGTLRPGQLLRNPDLADLLEVLVQDGPRVFYEGPVAQRIQQVSDGWVTRQDLAAYRVAWREPLVDTYRGWTVTVCGAPSVGGALVLGALAGFGEGPPLVRHPAPAEVWRLAAALARAEALRDETYEGRRHDAAWLATRVAACRTGNTVHVTAADAHGQVVGCTSTLGESSGLLVPGDGVVLNNFLGEDDIAPRDRHAARGERMMTSMCPTLLERDGTVVGLGSAGSSRIRTAIPQTLINHVDRGMDLATAIAAPRIHVEGGTLYVEGHGRALADVEALLAWPDGPARANWPLGFYFGGVQAVAAGPDGFDGGADIARRGCAVAFA